MKTEPNVFSIDHLMACKNQTEPWDGIRNYQARNFMRDDMVIGEKIFIYHSNAAEIGIVGVAEVASKPYPDPTQFDSKSKYFDAKSKIDNPRWILVDVKFVKKYPRIITLAELKTHDKLQSMRLLQKGNRLSVMPVLESEFAYIDGLV
jgi:predicted RNA-binding protein with PUA-like domain